MRKVLSLVGTSVSVKDSHYDNTVSDSIVLCIKKLDGTIKDVVGVDRNGYIYSIRYNEDKELVLLNTCGYGQIKDGKVEGWCFDRDGCTIDGYESTGYYNA